MLLLYCCSFKFNFSLWVWFVLPQLSRRLFRSGHLSLPSPACTFPYLRQDITTSTLQCQALVPIDEMPVTGCTYFELPLAVAWTSQGQPEVNQNGEYDRYGIDLSHWFVVWFVSIRDLVYLSGIQVVVQNTTHSYNNRFPCLSIHHPPGRPNARVDQDCCSYNSLLLGWLYTTIHIGIMDTESVDINIHKLNLLSCHVAFVKLIIQINWSKRNSMPIWRATREFDIFCLPWKHP